MRVLRFLYHLAGHLLTAAAVVGLLARFVPPQTLWYATIIALALPALLFGTLLYLGVTLWRREWPQSLFPGAVILFAVPLASTLFAFNPTSPSATTDTTIRVLTANLHSFRNDDFEVVKVDQATQFVEDLQLTALLLQEAVYPQSRREYVQGIKDQSGLSQRHQYKNRTVATYADTLQPVSAHFGKPRSYNGFIITDLATALGTVRLINAHLESNRISGLAGHLGNKGDLEAEVQRAGSMFKRYGESAVRRAEQANEIRRFVEESPHPVIVGGDFNDVPSSYTYRCLLTPRLQDAWVEAGTGLGTTFTGPLPGLRIDYLLVDTAFQVKWVNRVETGFSDHRALLVELGLRE